MLFPISWAGHHGEIDVSETGQFRLSSTRPILASGKTLGRSDGVASFRERKAATAQVGDSALL
jgi:hypothetical protein